MEIESFNVNTFYSIFHYFLQLKQGDPEDIFWGTLTVVPDKEFNPQEKVAVEGKLSSDAGKVQVDYFGEVASISGVYNVEKVQMEAEWDSKRLAFSVETPAFSLERLKLITALDTPFEGYRNLGITIDHVYNGNSMNSRAQGHLETNSASVALYGNLDSPQSTFSFMLEATGTDKLTMVAKMKESGATKWLEVTTGKGSQSSILKMEWEELQRSRTLHFDFSGCSFIPEVR